MAINKKLIHFKNFSDFNSKKLSANEVNTTYTVGVGGVTYLGAPEVLYQSVCWVKDTKQMWTHGTLYDCSSDGAKVYHLNESLSASGTLSQEAYDGVMSADIVIIEGCIADKAINDDGSAILVVHSSSGNVAITITLQIATDKTYTYTSEFFTIPTKVSELENDSVYISGTNIKTVMGKSLLGSGDVSISGSEITSIPATNIVAPTGIKNKSNDVWTIYSSQVPYHRANRLAFLEDDEFLFETSTDSGSTWTALSKNDDQRKVFIGENRGNVSFPSNPTNRVRVTLTPKTSRYFMADWFYIWASVPYASPAPTTVDIEYSTGSAPDTWLTYATNIPIEGQIGPNMIWYGKLMGSSTSNKNVRFTFKNNNNSAVNIQIKGIEAHGVKSWVDINTMARTDRIYSIGVDKSATFPGSINCTNVNISGDTIATQNTMKTINGQSIIGSGDIAPCGYERKIIVNSGQTCTLAVDNKYILTNVLSGQLTVQLPTTNPTSDNYTKECGVTFTTGSTTPTITFNGNILWVHGTTPTIEANGVYEFSFKFNFANNKWLGVYAVFKTE